MKAYYIRTEATEDKPAMTCVYPYRQWKELISDFKQRGIQFSAWSEHVLDIGDTGLRYGFTKEYDMNTDNENTRHKYFDNEYSANEFAKSVNGRVEFRPLPDYMSVIPNWVVYYSE